MTARSCFLSALLLCHSLVAVSKATVPQRDTLSTLRTVPVEANRRLRDTGLQKIVLDTLVLHENISHSMAEILTQNSAVFVKSYGRATESTAEFRGTSPSHTQVTWNGMRINSPMLGTVDFSTIPSHFIDEAALYHGASSIPLTGGGLGGAVEMKSVAPQSDGFGAQYVQGIGSFRTYDQFLRLNWKGRRWSSTTRVFYGRSENDFRFTNYDKKTDVRDSQGRLIRSYHPTERNKSGYFRDLHAQQDVFRTDNRGNRYAASVWYTHSLRGLPFLSVDYKEDSDFRNEQGADALRGILSWNHTRDAWSTCLRAGYAWQDIAYDYFTTRTDMRTDITHSRSRAHSALVQGAADWMPAAAWLLTASAELRYDHIRSRDRSPFHIGQNYNLGRAETSASAQARWRPVEPFTLAAVLRHESFGSHLVPPIPALLADYVLYRPWRLTAKASVARNCRHPSMNDLYFQPGGNPHLKSEQGFTYDGGLEAVIPLRPWTLSGSIACFDSHITDWIQWTPNAKGYWEPSNVKRVHNYGAELHLQAKGRVRAVEMDIAGNFAYTPSLNRGERTNANDASYGKQLPYVPRRSANLTARMGWRTWTLTCHWTHYGQRFTTTSAEADRITGRLRPYYMTDVSLGKEFRWSWASANVRLAVNNVLGTEYVTVLSRPMPPRNFEIYVDLKLHTK